MKTRERIGADAKTKESIKLTTDVNQHQDERGYRSNGREDGDERPRLVRTIQISPGWLQIILRFYARDFNNRVSHKTIEL